MQITISVGGNIVEFDSHKPILKNIRHNYVFTPVMVKDKPSFLGVDLSDITTAHARRLFLSDHEFNVSLIGELSLINRIQKEIDAGQHPELQSVDWAAITHLLDVQIH